MNILGMANAYLTFNANDEVLCTRCTGFNKPKNRARVVLISERTTPPPVNAEGLQRLHIEKDGVYLSFGRALCGVHDRSYRSDKTIKPDLLHNDVLLDFDILLRAYEAQNAKDIKRRLEEEERWAKHQREVVGMTEGDFTVQLDGRPSEMRWVINGPGHDGAPLVVAWVSLSMEARSWFVRSGDYAGHTGRGHGSPALARIMARLLAEAADLADQRNRKGQA